jgi:hypothetical protein
MPSEVKTGSQRWFLDIRTAPKTPKSLNNYKKRSIRLKKCPSTPVFQQPARVPRPRQFMPKNLRSIVRRLQKSDIDGRTDIICLLLDFNVFERQFIDRNISDTLLHSKESSGAVKDFTFIRGKHDFGFTYLCCDFEKYPEVIIGFPESCIKKMNDTSVFNWTGFAKDIGARKPYTIVFYSPINTPDNKKTRWHQEVLPQAKSPI